jgi:predicted nucleic acid-binding protein
LKGYVLDANAVIRYLRVGGDSGADRVQEIVAETDRVYISAANLGEVFYILLRHMSAQLAMQRIESLERALLIIPVDRSRSLAAAALKHRYGLGYADSFAAALAIEQNATLVSADHGFERCGRSLKWLRLPPLHS